jgi:hypothetical protein
MPVANNLHFYSAANHAAARLKVVKNQEYVVWKNSLWDTGYQGVKLNQKVHITMNISQLSEIKVN